MRQFRDAAGVEWNVYQTERNASAERRDHLLPAEYRHGWLLFESAREKRRLAPVPPAWNDLSDDALASLCASAQVQTRRGRDADNPSGDAMPRVADRPAAEPDATAVKRSLGSELHAVEQRLTESLEEVCETPDAGKLDTGELIRVEETLSIAADAAKKAVSLRQKRRT